MDTVYVPDPEGYPVFCLSSQSKMEVEVVILLGRFRHKFTILDTASPAPREA